MSHEERFVYYDVPANQLPLKSYVDRLMRAETLVFFFPTWCFGMPAMLKGFFTRLLMPSVAFDLSDPHNVKPALMHIKCISAVVTHGRPRWTAWLMGDPPRKSITRYLRLLSGGKAKTDYHACHHMNVATPPRLEAFKTHAGTAMARLA